MRHLIPVLALICSALGWPDQARALPRYTAANGQDCALCHENPTGGGLRTLYATQYIIPTEIAARGWPAEGEPGFIAGQSPEISPNITVGTDLRTLLYQQEGGTGATLAMQGDLYVNFRLSATASAYVEHAFNGSGEVFGLWRDLPLEGYLKAGRFVPDYGWRFADHQMFNRRYLLNSAGSDSPAFLYDSGLELGGSPGPLQFSASLLGGRESHGDNYAARLLWRREVGAIRLGLGGSVLRRGGPTGHSRAAGAFWYLSVGRWNWLGEIDETRRPDGAADAPRLGNLVAQEVTATVAQGVEARLTYSFQDPDRALATGARHRYGAGAAYMPRPYFAVQLMGNYWDLKEGPAVVGADYYEAELVIHFFY